MQGFQSKIVSVITADGRNFALTRPVTYIAVDGRVFVMPEGATSDGASTPPELWPMLPPFGLYWLAAYLHDCAYRNTLRLPSGENANLPKPECDLLLKEAMLSLGVDQLTAEKFYWGVSIGGWGSFSADRS